MAESSRSRAISICQSRGAKLGVYVKVHFTDLAKIRTRCQGAIFAFSNFGF